MSEPAETNSGNTVVPLSDWRGPRDAPKPLSSGGGGGTFDLMEQRVASLEKGFGEIQGLLKELRDGQHAAALSEAKQSGELNTKLAEFGGKLTNLDTQAAGLRRDLDKLPTEFGVAKIMVFVIGGLSVAAALLKTGWPTLSKLFGS